MTGSEEVIAFIPAESFINLTVTGNYCELNCPYCRGKYLRGMIDVSSPEVFRKVLELYYKRGARGYLISGGFSREGYLLIRRSHLRIVREFKRNKEVVFSIHLGLAPKELIDDVWSSGIDYVDFELPPSDKYVRYMKNLHDKSMHDYISLLDKLMDYGDEFVVPHLVVDSVMASQDDELLTMKTVSEFNPRLFVVLVEIRDSPNNNFARVYEDLKVAKRLFKEVSLGCMRSSRFKEFDKAFIKDKLINRIAVPKPKLIRELGLPVIKACCGIPRGKFSLFPLIKYKY